MDDQVNDRANGRPDDGAPPGAGADRRESGLPPGGTGDTAPWQSPSGSWQSPSRPWSAPGAPGANPWQGLAGPAAATPPPAGTEPPAAGGPDGYRPGQGWGGVHGSQPPGHFGGPGGRGLPPAPMYQAPPRPGVIPLRPLGLGEILDGAFQACRKNPVATFGTAILLQAVVALVTVLLLGNLFSSFEALDATDTSLETPIAALAGLGFFGLVTGVVSAVAVLLLQGIIVIPVARAVIDERTMFGQAWRLARGRLLPLLGLGLLCFAAGLVALALLVGISVLAVMGLEAYSALVIVPLALGALAVLVWISVKLVVAPATLMLEGTGPWTSIRRSWTLTRGNWWRTFGIVLLTSIIVSIIASVISAPLTFAVTLVSGFSASASATPDALDTLLVIAATQAVAALFTAIGYAFQAGVTSLLYVDLRMRREGFDVVLMREHEQASTGTGSGAGDILPGGTGSFGHQPGGHSR